MAKRLFACIDIETTGFNVLQHEIIEIACIIFKVERGSYETLEEIELKVKPERLENADPKALRINGYNEADWTFAYTLPQAMQILAEKTNGAIMVAHNISFDWKFLDYAFAKTEIEHKMNFRKLDTLSIAFAKLEKNPEVMRYSLSALSDYFGIENKKAHTALADTRATVELFKKLMAL